MIAKFLKIAGVKSQEDFYKKYPNENDFFKQHPEAMDVVKKAQEGATLVGSRKANKNRADVVNENNVLSNNEPINYGEMLEKAGYRSMNTTPLPNQLPPAEGGGEGGGGMDMSKIMGMFGGGDSEGGGGFDISSIAGMFGGGARNGTNIPKAQDGINTGQGTESGGMDNPNLQPDIQPINQPSWSTNPFNGNGPTTSAQNPVGSMQAGNAPTSNAPIGEGGYDPNENPNGEDGTEGFLKSSSKFLGPAGKVLQGISNLRKEREQAHRAEQAKQVSAVALQASATRPEAIERKYVRPEDNINDGSAFFPVYGVGTNVLAKEGASVKKYKFGGDIENMYIPKAQYGMAASNGMSGGGGAASGGGTPYAAIGTAGAGMANGLQKGGNAGGQIGGTIGKEVGQIWGPAGAMVGEIAGTAIGNVADPYADRAKKAGAATMRNIKSTAANNMAPGIQAQYSSVMENGGSLANGGELETHWGGEVEEISQNPYLPNGGDTVMFNGNSHDTYDGRGNTGIGVTYGNQPVEVEGGEPAMELEDENGETNLTVFGNLNIPKEYVSILGEDRAKGKKFKNYIALLSKDENKQTKIAEKSMESIGDMTSTYGFDKVKMDSLRVKAEGANMRLAEIADKKNKAGQLQEAIIQSAQEYGLDADALSKGKGKISMEDEYRPIAKKGVTINKDGDPVKTDKSDATLKSEGYKQTSPGVWQKKGNIVTTIKGTKGSAAVYGKAKSKEAPKAVGGGAPNSGWANAMKAMLNSGMSYEDLASKGHGSVAGLKERFPGEYKEAKGELIKEAVVETPDKIVEKPWEETLYKTNPDFEVKDYKRSPIIDAFNQILPYIRPTDQEDLDPNQLYGEMYALASNQVEPVQAQSYQPDLDIPYDISLQDHLNANQADYRSTQRLVGNNPSALAALNAQKYMANEKVLGEQFRLNQAHKDQVYDSNRNILNNAKLKNLDIYDRQATRQSQAVSNTKATAQAALNSISDKLAKHALENKTLGIYENLYNYRYDASGRAVNMNPLYQMQEQDIYSPTGEITHNLTEKGKGRINGYAPNGKTGIPSLATPGFNGNISNQPSGNNLYGPVTESQSLGNFPYPYNEELTPINPSKARNGKSMKKTNTQRDILRSLK